MSKAVVRKQPPRIDFRPIRTGLGAEIAAARAEAKAHLARGSHVTPCPCSTCVSAAEVKLGRAPSIQRPWK